MKAAKSAAALHLFHTPQARAVAAIALVTVAVLFAVARRQPAEADTTAQDVRSATTAATSRSRMQPQTMGDGARTTRSTTRAATTPSSSSSPLASSTPQTALAASAAPGAAQQSARITLTGCLEQNDGEFRLTDTEGDNAPRSRRWTSGFLRAKNRPVSVVDPRNQFRLADHVGERVNVSGSIVDGDMQVGALYPVGTSCKAES